MDPEVQRVGISIEVADDGAAHADAVRRGLEIVHPLTDEPWGIRRFFVREPGGTVIKRGKPHRGLGVSSACWCVAGTGGSRRICCEERGHSRPREQPASAPTR
jgi:hypothetical protein